MNYWAPCSRRGQQKSLKSVNLFGRRVVGAAVQKWRNGALSITFGERCVYGCVFAFWELRIAYFFGLPIPAPLYHTVETRQKELDQCRVRRVQQCDRGVRGFASSRQSMRPSS